MNGSSQSTRNTPSYLDYAPLAIGIGLILLTCFVISNTKEFLEHAMFTDGKVIEMKAHYSDGSTLYKPIVEFVTEDESLITFESRVANKPPAYSVGEIIEVVYLEKLPEEARIHDVFSTWGATLILGIISLVFCTLGILWLLQFRS